jgi:hypothetical protein
MNEVSLQSFGYKIHGAKVAMSNRSQGQIDWLREHNNGADVNI